MIKRLLPFILFISIGSFAQDMQKPIWKSNTIELYPDRIVQDNTYVARALSRTQMVSDYKSPANNFRTNNIQFKFSINGKDNEMSPGVNHHFLYLSATGSEETPVIKFGSPLQIPSGVKEGFLPANSKLKIRVDMRDVLSAFKQNGYYTLFNGEKLYKEDFKHLYVAGDTPPLMWDFNNLYQHPELELKDPDGDGIYETTLTMNVYDPSKQTAQEWKLSKDISAFPQYQSSGTLADAIYNMSIEEMIKAVEPDSTFRTGKEWAGVWTRDISYSIILSMAYLQPQVAKYSLLRKVSKKKKIIQDTGTGGAWPISSDRMIWATAAWELYKATGDNDWLQQAYTIISNSVHDDYANLYDKETGLVRGESSFLDWREESYPKWMQPVDIYESENLGTNAVHYHANVVLSQMANLLHKDAEANKYKSVAEKIKNGMNTYLWMPGKNYYAQYRYGRLYPMISPRSEALGEALSVLFDIPSKERQKAVVSHTPQVAYGIPCIFPQIPGIPPYHNNAIWPFVQSYWLWASAKAGNESSVMESIAAIYRPAAMFLTNKENFVADNGDFLGTQINSSNMLWSLSGNISIIHKVLFGIQFEADHLTFSPFVPKALAGKRSLTNFKYRDAVLNIDMEGYGNSIAAFYLDGKKKEQAIFPASLKGAHSIRMVLSNKPFGPAVINKIPNYFSLTTPSLTYKDSKLSWAPVEGAVHYHVIKDGKEWKQTTATSIPVSGDKATEYSVFASDKKGIPSFVAEPVLVVSPKVVNTYEAEDYAAKATFSYKGFMGTGFTEVSTTVNTSLTIPIMVPVDGYYFIDSRYANGNGPINTENKCAIRTVMVDNKKAGVFVLPQRGTSEWSNWGYTNHLELFLTKGSHQLRIVYLPENENMNLDINQAMIDNVRVIRLK
ncbi:MAG: MGH1-like glycoside hydrolase domain-containing protein [Candidatus Dadabacteria bacterium]